MAEILIPNIDSRYARRLRKIGKSFGRVALASTLFSGLYVAADYTGARLRWNENETYAVQTRENLQGQNDEGLLVLAGFGSKDGIKIADSIEPGVPENFVMGAMKYSDVSAVDMDKGPDAGKELADQIRAFVENEHVEKLSLYLHSMADELFLQALPHLQGVTIDTLVFDCGPYGLSTVYKRDDVEKGAEIPLPFGIISKTIYEINEATRGDDKNNSLSYFEQVKDGIRISLDGSSPFLARYNAKVLAQTNPADFKDYFKNIRRVVYLMPENPQNDHTIDVVQAANGWQALLGDKLEIMRIPRGGHADPMYRTSEYQAAVHYIFAPKDPDSRISNKIDRLDSAT